ncbi:type I restriction endonuclease subunit R [Mesomycoplasma lagogenitalium]|uniref:Type I restriction enzyme endonuclease subunit n=1 Tax=Mesomycoplasma lagogenitalium TaxID=171286 RepID=A0ABY8LW95_9BACT|nr:HsdR family type I site-specific deoxyribonuclease [Mesomycoplasma lagogenitalium]WGI36691.1 HsdR family type I site-specific deoxyribonuclease [Mesomycoplasma lagogenitalium]
MKNINKITKSEHIIETDQLTILGEYQKIDRTNLNKNYQSEKELEQELIKNLILQGYEKLEIHTQSQLYENLKLQIEKLNKIQFSEKEWARFINEYLDSPNDSVVNKANRIQENHIYDFKFDNDTIKNIKIIDKENLNNNHMQVINQIEQKGKAKNRYDVTILVNGLPLVHIELKQRGYSDKEAFNQIVRYKSESFDSEHSLYKYTQIFVISNGTYTKYFSNFFDNKRANFEFTIDWADQKNNIISDLEDFTKTFFEKRVVLAVLTRYTILTAEKRLLVMRPYQIAATEKILQKIRLSYNNKSWSKTEAGGYIWHTTGSGKTLTSFKTARLATELDFIDKVFFVVDRKDLDNQTVREYKKFQEDSVYGTKNTKELKKNIEKKDNKIIVTTIQKLNEFIKTNKNHEIFNKQCVLIFDECHRSQFGEAQNNIKKSFKKYYLFGFTGTPIFSANSRGFDTTESVFGKLLHSYIITHAIRDKKVLKFKIDYHNTVPYYKPHEENQESDRRKTIEREKMLIHENRIKEITKYILQIFPDKTIRNENIKSKSEHNAILAVQSIDAAKLYYNEFKRQQEFLDEDKKIKVTTIFSFAANEEKLAVGEIADEELETAKNISNTSKEFLVSVVEDFNSTFKTSYDLSDNGFQNFYNAVSEKTKNREIDLLIVVGMFLTGFDAPTLNTLFVDKQLSYHGLIQAFSRTNRINKINKPFGNIVCFRDLSNQTQEAIKLFGNEDSAKIIFEKDFLSYINGYFDENGKLINGYSQTVNELKTYFPNPADISGEEKEMHFISLINNLLRLNNKLKNYDEFKNYKGKLSDREMQDYKSTYIKIREKTLHERNQNFNRNDYSEIEFEIDLLKSEEINLDYIFRVSSSQKTVDDMKREMIRLIRSDIKTSKQEPLIEKMFSDYYNEIQTLFESSNNEVIKVKKIVEFFYDFVKLQKQNDINKLILNQKLKDQDTAYRFIANCINKGNVYREGTEINDLITGGRMSGNRAEKKQIIFTEIQKLVDLYNGI